MRAADRAFGAMRAADRKTSSLRVRHERDQFDPDLVGFFRHTQER